MLLNVFLRVSQKVNIIVKVKVKVKVKVNDANSFLWNHEYTQTEFA
jgi:hypothetical protein